MSPKQAISGTSSSLEMRCRPPEWITGDVSINQWQEVSWSQSQSPQANVNRNEEHARPCRPAPVYISYAWPDGNGASRDCVADRLYESLRADGYDVRRDTADLPYRGSIREFMKEIGRGACVIALVCGKYLRSPNCMLELLETHRNPLFRERLCPIVLSDAAIHSFPDRLEHVAYWKQELERIERLVYQVGIDVLATDASLTQYKEYQAITHHADQLLYILADINTQTPTIVEHNDFATIKRAIDEWFDRQAT